MTYIQTYSGKILCFDRMDPNSICITDIAQALAMQTRFVGQCAKHYSIAQHCVLVSIIMEKMYYSTYRRSEEALMAALYGLMHDASEAYMGDIPAPLKRMPQLQGYNELEERLLDIILAKYNVEITNKSRSILAIADRHILADEVSACMLDGRSFDWDMDASLVPQYIDRIKPWGASIAYAKYIKRFKFLKGEL